jgi:membrane-associated phospholipid phosphatase
MRTKKNCPRRLSRGAFAMTLFLAIVAAPTYAGGSGAFALDPMHELAIGLPGTAAFAAGCILTADAPNSAGALGWIDDDWTFPYNATLDLVGSITSVAAVAALPLLLDAFTVEDISIIAVMYAESAVWTIGLKNILKGAFDRPRPYLFYSNTPGNLINDEDPDNELYSSFPSGHTAIAFMTASFITYVYSKGDSSKTSKILVGAGVFALAGGTAALRIAAGTHYPSDVLAGALIGTAVGFLVPALHTQKPEKGWSLGTGAVPLSMTYSY